MADEPDILLETELEHEHRQELPTASEEELRARIKQLEETINELEQRIAELASVTPHRGESTPKERHWYWKTIGEE